MLRFNNGDCFGIRILVVLPVTPEPAPPVLSPDIVQLGDSSGGEKSVGRRGHGGWVT